MMHNAHVLVVEDDRYSGEVVAIMLKSQHVTVDIAPTAEKALRLLAIKSTYTLILIDLALPGMSGWELLRAIQEDPRWSRIPCAAMTAYHDGKVAQEANMAGFVKYFAKPLQTTFIKDIERLIMT
jgi:two-component system, chemotaxis family, CheB/CheR fusion protein